MERQRDKYRDIYSKIQGDRELSLSERNTEIHTEEDTVWYSERDAEMKRERESQRQMKNYK